MLEHINWRKTAFVVDGAFFLILALGFALHLPLMAELWPWMEQPLCSYFLAALLTAYGAGCLFLAYLGEWPAAVGGSIAMVVAFGGFALQVVLEEFDGRDSGLGVPAIILACIASIAGMTLYFSLKAKPTAARSAPPSLLMIFRTIVPLLCCVGIALLVGVHGVLPWPLSPQTRVLIGWIIIGFSANYAYTSLGGSWAAAQVLLAGLLSYDLAVIFPLLHHFTAVAPEYRPTLIINIVVVALTASLTVYYLFVSRHPRLGLGSF